MSDTTAIAKHEQREMLEGLGEEILCLVTDQEGLPSTVWGNWLAVPFERACAYGDERLASVLLKAGAKGFGLQRAARSGHRRVVSELLRLGAPPDSKNENGDTALHIAVLAGHASIVRTLLIEGAEKDLADGKGRSPLHLASFSGDAPSVRALLAAGANLALRIPSGEDRMSALDVAAWCGHVGVLQALIERGAMETVQATRSTPLHFAAPQNRVAAIRLLVDEGVGVNAEDAKGYTPLLHATVQNHAPAVEALCALGADLSPRVRTNFCVMSDTFAALDLAAYYGWTAIMQLLIQHGADVGARSANGHEALHKAAEGNEVGAIDVLVEAGAAIHGTFDFESPLHMAVDGTATQAIHALVRHGADPDWNEGLGATPLCRAVRFRDIGAVNALLAAGASPNISGNEETLLSTSVGGSDNEYCGVDVGVVRALLEHGARVDALNPRGEAALQAAAAWADGYVVDMLVEAGASVCTTCSRGRTPLHEASTSQNLSTATALLRHGAPLNAQDNRGNTALHHVVQGNEHPEDAWELVNSLLIAGADKTLVDHNGYTPASLPLEPTDHQPSELLREQLRELLLRAPADRADRAWRLWRRRGMVILCQASEKARRETGSRNTKSPRVAEEGGAAGDVIGEGRIDSDANFRGMMASLFCLRGGKEELFRQIITLL